MKSTIRRATVANAVSDELLQLIRNGTYTDGQRLPAERQLSSELGVSRSSLRDAFRQLEILGYLDIRQGDGTYVRSPSGETFSAPFRGLLNGSPQAALDLLEFRQMLEPEVAALAAQRATPEHAATFAALLDQQRHVAAQGLRISKQDQQFHEFVAQIAGNTVVLHVLATLRSLLSELRQTTLTGRYPAVTITQHEHIANAILTNDAAGARAAMLTHLTTVVETNDLKPTPHAQS